MHKETGALHPRSAELLEQVALRIEQEGIEAWFQLDAAELLGDEASQYRKLTDTLDVWFDSGSTHYAVLRQRDELKWPADLYLEGSDQHRGWFQSSMLTGCAHRPRPLRPAADPRLCGGRPGPQDVQIAGQCHRPQKSTTPWAPTFCVCGWPRRITRASWRFLTPS